MKLLFRAFACLPIMVLLTKIYPMGTALMEAGIFKEGSPPKEDMKDIGGSISGNLSFTLNNFTPEFTSFVFMSLGCIFLSVLLMRMSSSVSLMLAPLPVTSSTRLAARDITPLPPVRSAAPPSLAKNIAPPPPTTKAAPPPPPPWVTLQERWARANHTYMQVQKEYSAHLLDIRDIFHRPLLTDLSVKETAEFMRLYGIIYGYDSQFTLTQEYVETYENRTSALAVAWRAANEKATKVGLKQFNMADRRKVELAINLLNMALDPGASDSERESAYSQVKKLIDGLILIPKGIQLQIETIQRKRLSAA